MPSSPAISRKMLTLPTLMRSIAVVVGLMAAATGARAEYGRVPFSEVDTGLFRIDETKFLGVKPDRSTPLRDETGQPVTLGQLADKPTILVLSYFNCDGTCNVVNGDLAGLLNDVSRWKLGQDFRVLTVSFDARDDVETLAKFRQSLHLPNGADQGWRFAVAAAPEEAKRLADTVGFKYFWSSEDRAFLHPGLYVFLSREGRVVRYLYSTNSRPLDVELAITDAMANEITPKQFRNLALGLCYSYNFKDGRYKLNVPLFAGFASLLVGGALFLVSSLYYRRRARGRTTNENPA